MEPPTRLAGVHKMKTVPRFRWEDNRFSISLAFYLAHQKLGYESTIKGRTQVILWMNIKTPHFQPIGIMGRKMGQKMGKNTEWDSHPGLEPLRGGWGRRRGKPEAVAPWDSGGRDLAGLCSWPRNGNTWVQSGADAAGQMESISSPPPLHTLSSGPETSDSAVSLSGAGSAGCWGLRGGRAPAGDVPAAKVRAAEQKERRVPRQPRRQAVSPSTVTMESTRATPNSNPSCGGTSTQNKFLVLNMRDSTGHRRVF